MRGGRRGQVRVWSKKRRRRPGAGSAFFTFAGVGFKVEMGPSPASTGLVDKRPVETSCPTEGLHATTTRMKAIFNRLTTAWNLTAVVFAMWAWLCFSIAKGTTAWPFWAFFTVFAVVGAGLLLRQRWARLAALVLLVLMLGMKVSGMVLFQFKWGQALYAVGIAYAAYCLWKRPDLGLLDDFPEDGPGSSQGAQDDAENKEDARPIISLVHLRSQQRYLEAPMLAHALSEAWSLNIVGGEDADADSADGFVAGESPMFVVMVQKPTFAMFMVHNHDSNYFDAAEEVAAGVPNLRFARIIREHDAWLAVDLMQVKDTRLDHDEAYRLIGKAVSALADDAVQAIVCPQHRFFNLWSPELEAILCGDTPLDALKEEVKAPVIGVPDGAVIENAMAEARRRWPEFVACFKNRQPDDKRFIVKAPFPGEDGQTEHMWLQVFGLEPEYVHGHLMNHPMHTTKLKQGSQVEVPVADISDWICPDAEENALGNFTHHAVAQAAKARAQE